MYYSDPFVGAYYENGEKDGEEKIRFFSESDDGEFNITINGTPRKFCVLYCDENVYRVIRAEADQWRLIERYKEDWDPSFGHRNMNKDEVSVAGIPDQYIWLKDGAFGGVIILETQEYRAEIELKAVCKEQYQGTPVYIGSESGYGSSDRDMACDRYYYLADQDWNQENGAALPK